MKEMMMNPSPINELLNALMSDVQRGGSSFYPIEENRMPSYAIEISSTPQSYQQVHQQQAQLPYGGQSSNSGNEEVMSVLKQIAQLQQAQMQEVTRLTKEVQQMREQLNQFEVVN